MEKSKELIYGLNDRPPIRETIFAALQHLLAIFVAIITDRKSTRLNSSHRL